MAKHDTYLLIDFDDCQMETERKCRASLADRVNELYGDLMPEPFTPEIDLKYFTGKTTARYCLELEKMYNIKVDCKAVYDRREERVRESLSKMEGGIPMAPHLIETLQELQGMGYKLATVTNSPHERLETVATFANNGRGKELLALFGENIFSSTQVARSKPDPDVYLYAMEKLGIKPDQGIAFEDSTSGLKASRSAQLVTLGNLVFAEDKQKSGAALKEMGALYLFRDWKETPEQIISVEAGRKLIA